jgi:hypothetical protein
VDAINCILCDRQLEKRTDKNGKPYFVCDTCGTQFFVRGPNGIRNLDLLIRDGPHLRVPKNRANEIRALIRDMKALPSHTELLPGDDRDWIDKFSEKLGSFLEWISVSAREN